MEPSRMLRSLALMTAPARANLMCSTVTMVMSLPSISKALPTRKSFVSIKEVLHRQQVALRSQAGDHTGRRGRGNASGAESLPFAAGVQVREVDLDDRSLQSPKTIVERVRGVGERSRIEHDAH